MSAIEVTGVSKTFGKVRALDAVDLAVPAGAITALLGPSGCGKTTLLRVIAGFEQPDSGTVALDGVAAAGIRPERRLIGFVAQEGALFPHRTVAGNIGFGLARSERGAGTRIRDLLSLVDLPEEVLGRYPHELSGGQQQRVALARALARRPRVVLLDEPFAALDTGLRLQTRTLMGQALRAEGVTTVLVTHDQEEALSFADEVVLMRAGRVRQTGAPQHVYARPTDLWAAAFLGDAVALPGRASGGEVDCALGRLPVPGSAASGEVTVMIRPEQLVLGAVGSGVTAAVTGLQFHGHDSLLGARLADGELVTVRLPGGTDLSPGDRIGLRVAGTVCVYPPQER